MESSYAIQETSHHRLGSRSVRWPRERDYGVDLRGVCPLDQPPPTRRGLGDGAGDVLVQFGDAGVT